MQAVCEMVYSVSFLSVSLILEKKDDVQNQNNFASKKKAEDSLFFRFVYSYVTDKQLFFDSTLSSSLF